MCAAAAARARRRGFQSARRRHGDQFRDHRGRARVLHHAAGARAARARARDPARTRARAARRRHPRDRDASSRSRARAQYAAFDDAHAARGIEARARRRTARSSDDLALLAGQAERCRDILRELVAVGSRQLAGTPRAPDARANSCAIARRVFICCGPKWISRSRSKADARRSRDRSRAEPAPCADQSAQQCGRRLARRGQRSRRAARRGECRPRRIRRARFRRRQPRPR